MSPSVCTCILGDKIPVAPLVPIYMCLVHDQLLSMHQIILYTHHVNNMFINEKEHFFRNKKTSYDLVYTSAEPAFSAGS